MGHVISADNVHDALTEPQRAVMSRVLAEEQGRREHLVVYLSGAHAYGFPSPDSDLDLKAIHIADTGELVGLRAANQTFDRAEIIDGVEIDYTSNELAAALAGILEGNGNYIERVLGRMTAHASPLLTELMPIAKRALSRRAYRHYRGFAQSQLRFLEKEPTAKKLLYVLRTAVTGIHLLETGELEADLVRVMDQYDLGDARAIIERKRGGERTGIDPALVTSWKPRIEALFARLDHARERSALPEAPANEPEVATWLLSVRRTRFNGRTGSA
jgi:uncharacterized protein